MDQLGAWRGEYEVENNASIFFSSGHFMVSEIGDESGGDSDDDVREDATMADDSFDKNQGRARVL